MHSNSSENLDSNNINVTLIPANCTDRLQLLDISVNKAVKDFLLSKLQEWFAKQVKKISTIRQDSQSSH